MTSNVDHEVVETLLRRTDRSWPLEAGWLGEVGADAAAAAALAEVIFRAGLTHENIGDITVEWNFRVDGRPLPYVLTVDGAGPRTEAGRDDDAVVVIQLDLAELVYALFGQPGQYAATRQIIVRERKGRRSLDPNDPTNRRRARTVAATQRIVAALSSPGADLTALAVRFGSDKWGSHWYTQHYDRYLARFRDRRITLLEIGVGGYHYPARGGASLRMWKHYFRRGLVYGLDIYDKSELDESRLRTIAGDQGDPATLKRMADDIGPFDVVIDDGSHLNRHVITSFETLFPHVRPGGLYIIEDTQTAYWSGWGGTATAEAGPGTSVGLVKRLLDGLHHQEWDPALGVEPSTVDRTVTGVHVHHNVTVIEKGVNAEQSAPAWIPRDQDPAAWLYTAD